MASRRSSRHRDELHIEELDEPELESRAPLDEERTPPSAPVRGGLEASLLQFFGALGLVGSLGLWVGAGFHEGLARSVSALGGVSLHPATLAVWSLTLLAFGRIRRAQVDLARQGSGHDDGLLEQVATTQVHERHSLERLARANTEIVDALGALREELQAVAAAQQAPSDDSGEQEAIFRLAASLDQLGARVEQRMQSQFESFQAGLQQVGGEIVAAQSDLRSFLASLPAGPGGDVQVEAQADPFSEPLPQGEPPAPQGDPEPYYQPDAAMPAGGAGGVPSLGVLDSIPDEATDPLPPLRAGTIGPIPASSAAEEFGGEGIQKSTAHSPAERAMELDTQTKLTQLTDLLADDRLRAALDDMRRNG